MSAGSAAPVVVRHLGDILSETLEGGTSGPLPIVATYCYSVDKPAPWPTPQGYAFNGKEIG